ncbi:MAG: Bug family tripartite tricarboxylate transporter substrate binding protein, partial [Pollutimonas bauzanensis]
MDNLLEPARRPHRLRQCLSKTAIPVVLALAGLLAPQARAAQEASWPTRQVRIIVPYGPGGIADISARSIAQKMAENTGQPFVVENKPGADTRIGTEYVARMSGDSHILLLGGGGFAVNNALFDKLPYDTASDFIPVGLVVSNPLLLVTGIQQPYANLGELIAAAKNGETITLASGGNGTLSHMSMELLSAAMGAPITHVPYKGGSAHTSDVVGGRVTGIFENPSSALPVLRAGRYKAIAITSAARNPAMPDVPTVAESGAADFEVVNWFGLFAPAGVPEAAVER